MTTLSLRSPRETRRKAADVRLQTVRLMAQTHRPSKTKGSRRGQIRSWLLPHAVRSTTQDQAERIDKLARQYLKMQGFP